MGIQETAVKKLGGAITMCEGKKNMTSPNSPVIDLAKIITKLSLEPFLPNGLAPLDKLTKIGALLGGAEALPNNFYK